MPNPTLTPTSDSTPKPIPTLPENQGPAGNPTLPEKTMAVNGSKAMVVGVTACADNERNNGSKWQGQMRLRSTNKDKATDMNSSVATSYGFRVNFSYG